MEHFPSHEDEAEGHHAEASQRGNSKESGQVALQLTRQRQTMQARMVNDWTLSVLRESMIEQIKSEVVCSV